MSTPSVNGKSASYIFFVKTGLRRIASTCAIRRITPVDGMCAVSGFVDCIQ